MTDGLGIKPDSTKKGPYHRTGVLGFTWAHGGYIVATKVS